MKYKERQLHDDLLRYGTRLFDLDTEEVGGFRRVRVFELNGDKYVHHMFNGNVVEIIKL